MDKKARIGVIGAGYWATSFYLPFLRDHPDVDIVGVVRQRRDEQLEALLRAFPMESATTEIGELLARGCDGVIVASPHEAHANHGQAALEAGVHVLMEKPMAITLREAIALTEAAKRFDRVITVAHGWNYSELAAWAMTIIDSGKMGQTTSISGHMASSLFDMLNGRRGYGRVVLGGVGFEAAPDWRIASGLRGGYLYGQMSHQLGLALLLERDDPAEVYACAGCLVNGVDIDVNLSVRFAHGQIGSFSGHGRLPRGVRYPLEIRLAAEGGVLTLDFERERADVYLEAEEDEHDDENTSTVGVAPDSALKLAGGEGVYNCEGPPQFLIDVCLGRPAIDRAPAELGVRTVAILEAAVRSIETNEPVCIEKIQTR